MRRLIGMGLSVLVLILVLGCLGCEGRERIGASGSNGEAGSGFDLSVCFASEPHTMDPNLVSAMDVAEMLHHTHEGLMKWVDSGSPATDKGNMNYAALAPGQAASYQKMVQDDGTVTYRFKIRPDARWSDGRAVTADDFVYSWQRLAAPQTGATYCYMIDMVQGYGQVNSGAAGVGELAVSAPAPDTFQVVLSYDCPYFLEVCAWPATFPVRKDIVEANPDTWTTANSSAGYITNGPWKLAEWVHDSYIKVVPNQYYYDVAKLGPSSITFRLNADRNTMLAGYRANELQFIYDIPVDEVASLLASGELAVVDYVATEYISYQTQKPPFNDWRVRKAFTLAVDNCYIVEQVTQGGEIPAAGFVPAGIYDADFSGADFRTIGGDYWELPTTREIYARNVAQAKALLAEAGYPEGKGFPVVTYLYDTNDRNRATAEALQQMWRKELGITVHIQNQDWNAFLETRKQGDYQIARNGWLGDSHDPISFLDMWITGGGNNDAQYSSAEYDTAIAEAKASADPAVRMAAMHRAEDILIGGDWVLGPLYFYTQKYLMKDNVDGAFYTPLGYFIFSYITKK